MAEQWESPLWEHWSSPEAKRRSVAQSSADASGDSGDGSGGRRPWHATDDLEDAMSSAVGCGDGSGGRPPRSAQLPTDDLEKDLVERLDELEAQMGRVCKMVGELRRKHADVAAQLLEAQQHITSIQQWTSWLGRLHVWLKDFPWHY